VYGSSTLDYDAVRASFVRKYQTRCGRESATAGSRLAAALPIVRRMSTKEKICPTSTERWRWSAALPAVLALRSRSGRAERAITEQQVFGRRALAASVPGGEVVD
jgi:hypothetical protein